MLNNNNGGSTSFICSDHTFRSIIIDGSILDPNTGPYYTSFLACHAVALATFIISSASGNLSQVDKLWSILPTIYAWMCVVDSRTTLMACLSTLWSLRLTYNFYRRGGYAWPPWQGDEDYRWECIRRGVLGGGWTILTNKLVMVVFNFFFISLYQNYLLLFIATPSLVAWSMAMKGIHCRTGEEGDIQGISPPLNVIDGIACFLFLAFLRLEAMADNLQYNFQTEKKKWKLITEKEDSDFATLVKSLTSYSSHLNEYKNGFCQSGLFAIVRKPAYAGEQGIWISYYLFSIAPGYSQNQEQWYWNWSGGGFVLLCILFQGSGWLTEQISISKYPSYRSYQKKVPLYIPKISSLWNLLIGYNESAGKQE